MMHRNRYSKGPRALKTIRLEGDLTIVGGGLSGVCAAIVAARQGLKVVLIQDRPVLGGNASSEVRLWALGATSHQGNNNRFSREGGVIDEIMVENMWRNPEGNPVLFDMVLIDKVRAEENITLLLNTTMFEIRKSDNRTISGVMAFNCQTSTLYDISSPFFCDASGDGMLGYMAGASFRVGAEDGDEFGEKFVPEADYGQMLGHSIFFYTKDTGKPVRYVAPDFALKDIKRIPRYTNINAGEHGCRFWWLEYGARLDTVHDTEEIKFELWKIVFGVWDYIKNSGKYPGVENLTLEWVGLIPGKRESRRFEGLYMINQNDIISQAHFPDAVAFGGWAIDLHPADGVYSPESGCMQFHSKGIYSIPYRCMVSRDIDNLFFAGRILSATHVAFGSTRVMMTVAHCAQAVGMAAAVCKRKGIAPAEVAGPEHIFELQTRLSLMGQGIPFVPIPAGENLASMAEITASSTLVFSSLPFDGGWRDLEFSAAQILPLQRGVKYTFTVEVRSEEQTTLEASLRYAEKAENFTPDTLLESCEVSLRPGVQRVEIRFAKTLPEDRYAFLCFEKQPGVQIRESARRVTGIVSVFQKYNKAVAKSARQTPPEGSGIDSFDFWVPERRPGGANLAMTIDPGIGLFEPRNLVNGYVRPFILPNAWVAEVDDLSPSVIFRWNAEQVIREVTLYFDTDYDHAMESVQMGHSEHVIPFCIRNYDIIDEKGRVLRRVRGNYTTINRILFPEPLRTRSLTVVAERPDGNIPAAIFQILIR